MMRDLLMKKRTTFFLYFTACVYGLYQSMYPTILIDCIGLERFQSSLGFVTLVHGISIAVFFPISGMCTCKTVPYLPPVLGQPDLSK